MNIFNFMSKGISPTSHFSISPEHIIPTSHYSNIPNAERSEAGVENELAPATGQDAPSD